MALTNHSAAVELTIAEMREHFCVYAQYLDGSAEDIFYVGVCKFADVYKYPDAYKNTHWRATISDASRIKTLIVATSPLVAECFKQATFVITNYKPICNMKGYQAAGRTIITCTQGPLIGQSWTTQEETARANGVSQPALSNHLNGRQGYIEINGMRFKRGI